MCVLKQREEPNTFYPYQECVIRSFGMFNTVKYALKTEFYVRYDCNFKHFRECQILTQNGPNSPQNHPKRSQSFSNILCVINILYNSIGSSLKGRCGAEIA